MSAPGRKADILRATASRLAGIPKRTVFRIPHTPAAEAQEPWGKKPVFRGVFRTPGFCTLGLVPEHEFRTRFRRSCWRCCPSQKLDLNPVLPQNLVSDGSTLPRAHLSISPVMRPMVRFPQLGPNSARAEFSIGTGSWCQIN